MVVGGVGSSRHYRVSQGDDVDVSSAQYFVNSSLAPVILFRRRLKSVADVLKAFVNTGSHRIGWMPCIGTGLRWVGRDRVGLWFLWSLGLVGFLLISMVFPLVSDFYE